jgi:hypothetical protein
MAESRSRTEFSGNARRARAVGSTAACAELRAHGHPPCGSWLRMSPSVQRSLARWVSCMARVVGEDREIVKRAARTRQDRPGKLAIKYAISDAGIAGREGHLVKQPAGRQVPSAK